LDIPTNDTSYLPWLFENTTLIVPFNSFLTLYQQLYYGSDEISYVGSNVLKTIYYQMKS